MISQDEIEKIFGARFENSAGEKPEWYCESSELPLEDQKWIWDNIPAKPQVSHQQTLKQNNKTRSKVLVKGIKGNMVTNVSSDSSADALPTKKECSRDGIAFKLAEALEDIENLPYYEKLINKRRSDFLRNCLVITLSAARRGIITKTKAAYFTGVVKGKTALQERIKKYKRKKHTT